MPRERSSIEDLALHSTPTNLRKALKLRATKPDHMLAKRDELEKLFADAKHEYELASDDVRIRGSVISVTRYTAKGAGYEIEITNPSFKVMNVLSQRMSHLARMLSVFEIPNTKPGVVPGSAAELFPELFSSEEAS